MILFVFEGRDDKTYFESVKRLFFPEKADTFVCTYNSNIYSLYRKLKDHDVLNGLSEVDTVSVLKEILLEKGDETLKNIREDEVSEIYLFFDYDFQEKGGNIEENNRKLSAMLEYFTDETDTGKLYINYPMVESLRYTRELPDDNYWSYTVTRQKCIEESFKHQVHVFSFYGGNLEYIILTLKPADDETAQQEKTAFCKKNWQYLIAMNVRKANYICTGENELPDVENTQQDVYDNQLAKFVNTEECKVAILNAFPIFLYEYFGRKVLMSN
ncbi:MAG: hypothetical protein IKI72_00325 [Bacteroidales bacterium]|nr:hypothetical protein [Bacteroidales bacterium]